MVGNVGIQVRARFDRGAHFHGLDITLRTTEPPMIARREYAPLLLYVWFEGGLADFGYLVDVYAMAHAMERGRIRAFDERPAEFNHDNTAFKSVSAGDLNIARALLGIGNRHTWTPTPWAKGFRLRSGQSALAFE